MNIILFDAEELTSDALLVLPASDERARHIDGVLRAEEGHQLRGGVINGGMGRLLLERKGSTGIELRFFPDAEARSVDDRSGDHRSGDHRRGHDGSGDHRSGVPAGDSPDLFASTDRRDVVWPGGIPIDVIIGSIRPIQLKRLFRDLTAFGVRSITVVRTHLSEASYFHSNIWQDNRLRRFLIEGAMQGGHTVLPGVSRVASMGRALEGVSGRTDVARVYLDADASVYTVAGSRKDYPSVAIAVGPERGFTDGEKEALTQAGFRAIRLPAGILRTESAAIAGVAVVCACLATA